MWVRVRRREGGSSDGDGDGTLVEVAGLDRSGGGDVPAELEEIVVALRGRPQEEKS